MEQVEGCYGCRMLARRAADAQATIAALQARVQELEDDRSAWKEIAQDWSAAAKLAEQPEKFYEGYSAAVMNAMQALLTKARAEFTQRTVECDALKLVNDTHMKTVMKLSHVVEQRTAELEAANKLLYKKNCALGRAETIINDLQAELERVSADNKALDKWRADVTMALQRPEGAFFVDVPQHIKDLVAELERVRKKLGETKLYLQQERANRDSLVACVNRDVKTIKELRTLIAANKETKHDAI